MALSMTKELLEIDPTHERAVGNKIYYEKELAKAESTETKALRGDDGSDSVPVAEYDAMLAYKLNPTSYDSNERKVYEMMCRGEVFKTAAELAELKCKYVTNGVPFLKISPLKLEEANLKPYLVIYHDVLYDNEIEIIKQLAKPRVRFYFSPSV